MLELWWEYVEHCLFLGDVLIELMGTNIVLKLICNGTRELGQFSKWSLKMSFYCDFTFYLQLP